MSLIVHTRGWVQGLTDAFIGFLYMLLPINVYYCYKTVANHLGSHKLTCKRAKSCASIWNNFQTNNTRHDWIRDGTGESLHLQLAFSMGKIKGKCLVTEIDKGIDICRAASSDKNLKIKRVNQCKVAIINGVSAITVLLTFSDFDFSFTCKANTALDVQGTLDFSSPLIVQWNIEGSVPAEIICISKKM